MKQKNQQMIIPMNQPQGVIPLINEQTYRHITIPLDGPIEDDLSLYRDCIEEIRDANEGDFIRVIINTDGGSLQTALAIIAAIEQSDAEVVADIEGMAASAGSLIALHCQGIQLNPYSTMFIHSESFGSLGKRHEVKTQVEFSLKWVEKIIRDTYQYFLSEEEIELVLEGRDMYFDAEQIKDRFENRIKMLQELHEDHQDLQGCEGNCEDCNCGDDYDEEFYCNNQEDSDGYPLGTPQECKTCEEESCNGCIYANA